MLFLTARDIARILNISKSATYQIIHQSEIPVVRINRNVCLSVIIFPCVIRYSTPPIPALNGSLVPSPPNAIFITIFSLIVIQLYRQFVLHQPQEAWNDIAMLLTANIHFLLGLTLYLTGAINPREIKLRNILVGYALFVLVGFLFTTFKYAVLLGQEINLLQVWIPSPLWSSSAGSSCSLWVSWPTWATAGSTNRYPEHHYIHYSSRLLKSKL